MRNAERKKEERILNAEFGIRNTERKEDDRILNAECKIRKWALELKDYIQCSKFQII